MKIFIEASKFGFGDKPWWPGSASGGSEWQCCTLARELVALGHDVTVRNRCGVHEDFYEGVKYLDFTKHSLPTKKDKIDVYCSQRDPSVLKGTRIAPVQIILSHDIPSSSHYPTQDEIKQGALDNTDIVMCLNEYHKNLMLEWGTPPEKVKVCPIAIDVSDFTDDVDRVMGRCIYCSCPDRGLEVLLEKWVEIHKRCKWATLQIAWNIPIIRPFYPYAKEGIPDLGILPQKVLLHKDLGVELCKAELQTYFSVSGIEISPAACIKSMAAGAVPIVVPTGGMREVVCFGHQADSNSFVNAVVNGLTDLQWQHDNRIKMIPATREKYYAPKVTKQWLDIVEKFRSG